MILVKEGDQSQEGNAKSREDSGVCSFVGIAFQFVSADGCACSTYTARGIRGVGSAASNFTGTGVTCCALEVTGSTCQADCSRCVGGAVGDTSTSNTGVLSASSDLVECGSASSADCSRCVGAAVSNCGYTHVSSCWCSGRSGLGFSSTTCGAGRC